MMTNAQIRAFARNQLRGNWGAVIGAGFLILFSMFAYFVVLYAVVVHRCSGTLPSGHFGWIRLCHSPSRHCLAS